MRRFRPFNLDDAFTNHVSIYRDFIRKGWDKTSIIGDDPDRFHLEWNAPDSLKHLLRQTFDDGHLAVSLNFHIYNLLVKQGVRLFRPTLDQCIALMHVDLTLLTSEYQQPYHTMIVELPHRFCEMEGFDSPYCVLTHDGTKLFGQHTLRNGLIHFSAGGRHFIEEGLHLIQKHHKAVGLRVAINACMLLANYPIHTRNMLPPDLVRANRNRAHSQGRTYLPPQEITLVQNIQFHEVRHEPETLGASRENLHHKTAHWRRGHWRMHAFGLGFQQHRRIFIKPVLINPRFDTGGERQVIYES